MANEEGKILHSNTLHQWSKAPYFSRFNDFVVAANLPLGKITLTFYEGSNKAVQVAQTTFKVVSE